VRGRTSAKALTARSAPGTAPRTKRQPPGRDAAQADKVEHVIKNQNGQIGAKNSYGHDPRNIAG
jgi:hypothetical protein